MTVYLNLAIFRFPNNSHRKSSLACDAYQLFVFLCAPLIDRLDQDLNVIFVIFLIYMIGQ